MQKNHNKKNIIADAMSFRHACKIFDTTKTIPSEDLDFILEAGRLSPSSFGMEHWEFVVVTNFIIKQKLKPHCWNQNQIDSCSHLIAMVAKVDAVKPYGDYRGKMLERKGLSQDSHEAYLKKYDTYIEKMTLQEISFWSQKQCYIAGANMTLAAAALKIDSCFIEGFEPEAVSSILGIEPSKKLAYLLAFGYRANEQPLKYRLPIENITRFID